MIEMAKYRHFKISLSHTLEKQTHGPNIKLS